MNRPSTPARDTTFSPATRPPFSAGVEASAGPGESLSVYCVTDSEERVLGAIVENPESYHQAVKAGLEPEHFADSRRKALFAAADAAYKRGEPVSMESSRRALPGILDGTTAERLVESACFPHEVAFHAKTIMDAANRRRFRDALVKAQRQLAEPGASPELIAAELETALATMPSTADASAESLADLPDPLPEGDNPAALFRRGWLRKGGGAFLVAPSGQGKSTWTIQAAVRWSMGLPAFGIEPVRPLKIAIIQAEDDAEEMAFFRNQITTGLVSESGLDRRSIDTALGSILLADMTGLAGKAFVDRVAALLRAHPELDLLIVNPFQSFFGGDVSHNSELTEFLRVWLDPILKPSRCAVLFVHHTNKPPTAKERGGWGTDAFAGYIGAGGAELANWARAMLALMPVESMPGVFRLVAGKRGQRLGWVDASGGRTNTRLIAHHSELIFWRDCTDDEVQAAQGMGDPRSRKAGDEKEDAEALAVHLRNRACSLTEARVQAEQLFGRARGRRAFDRLKSTLTEHLLTIETSGQSGKMFIGRPGDAKALARGEA